MERLSQLAYIIAAIEFVRGGHQGGAIVALVLLAWAIVVGLLAQRSAWEQPVGADGRWTSAITHDSAEVLTGLWRLGFVARFLSLGLSLFGPLLLVWSLIL